MNKVSIQVPVYPGRKQSGPDDNSDTSEIKWSPGHHSRQCTLPSRSATQWGQEVRTDSEAGSDEY